MQVRYAQQGAVAVITLDRPDARNAVTREMFEEITAGVARAESHGAGAIVLAGAGDYFCAGVDLAAMADAAGREEEVFTAVLQAGNGTVRALDASPLPSVSAVQGGAVGGGLGLALATDLCVAEPGARFSTQYGKVGFTPDVGVSYRLTQRLGPRLAAGQLLRSPTLSAQEAVTIGLIDLVTDSEPVLGAAVELATGLAQRSAVFVRGTRALTAQAAASTLEEQLNAEAVWIDRCWQSPSTQAYIAAFARRKSDPSAWSSLSGL